MRRFTTTLLAALLAGLLVPGCRDATPPDAMPDPDHAADAAATPTNRIAVPASVRRNLGITFVTAERRPVQRTLRVPGRFELEPTARREYRTMLPGRVEITTRPLERVEAGDVLYRLDSTGWRQLQRELTESVGTIRRLEAKAATFGPRLDAHRDHEDGLRESIALLQQRVEQLEALGAAGGGRAGDLAAARVEYAQVRTLFAEVREKNATLLADRLENDASLEAERGRRRFLLQSAASLLGTTADTLGETGTDGQPRWSTIDTIEVRAAAPGVVESLGATNGAWADEKTTIVTIVRPEQLRFHAEGLQSDLARLQNGLEARIVPPTLTRRADALDLTDTMRGRLVLGIGGDPQERTVDLFVTPETLSTWARPGMSAHLEIITGGTDAPALAVPRAAVQRDGTRLLLFRRDPRAPDEVIRIDADLGTDDGRWVVIESGLRDGDEVVLDGAYQLMLASSDTAQKGGHFHADGTFHEEGH